MALQQKSIQESQKNVLRFGSVGILLMGAMFVAGWYLLPVQTGKLTSLPDKLAFTLRWQALSSFALVCAILLVGHIRFTTAAIDPTSETANKHLGIYPRFLQNTLEQLVISVFGQLVLTTYVGDNLQRIIPILAITFVVARVIFFVGYLSHPLHRATGFAMSMLPSAVTQVYCVYCLFTYGPMYGLN